MNSCSRFASFAVVTTAALAAPIQYEFSGTITKIDTDEAGLIAGGGLGVGQSVQFTFEVDTDRPAYWVNYDGTTTILPDFPLPGQLGNLYLDQFAATFVGGSHLVDPAAEGLRPNGGSLELHNGVLDTSAGLNSVTLLGGGVNYTLGVTRYNTQGFFGIFDPLPWGFTHDDPRPGAWTGGETLLGFASATDARGLQSRYESEVTLTRVTTVPEPASVLLALVGFGGLVTVRNRRSAGA